MIDLVVNTDGGCPRTPGPAAWAFVARHGDDPVVERSGYLPTASNNIAEYTAVIEALKWLQTIDERPSVTIQSDSELVVKQMLGAYAVRQPHLLPLWAEAIVYYEALQEIMPVRITHVRREYNTEPDALCRAELEANGYVYKTKSRKKREKQL